MAAGCETVPVNLQVVVVAPPYYTIPPRGYGGTEQVCYQLVRGLVARGHRVTLVAAGPNLTEADFVATFDAPQPEGAPNAVQIEVVHTSRAAAAIARLRPDIVHDHTQTGMLSALHRDIPTLVTCHHAVAGPDSFVDHFRALGPLVRLVSVSHAQRGDAPDLNWVGTVHNGITVSEFPYRAQKDDFLLYLGRISEHKGVHLAVRAARAAGRRLVLAGSWTIPEERDYFEATIRPHLGPQVEWLGELTGAEKSDVIAAASALLFPARWHEPFGLALIEALACGTPVIALRAGAVDEIIDDGLTGFVCAEFEDLEAAVRRLDEIDPARCRETVLRRFDAEVMVSAYEALYLAQIDPGRLT